MKDCVGKMAKSMQKVVDTSVKLQEDMKKVGSFRFEWTIDVTKALRTCKKKDDAVSSEEFEVPGTTGKWSLEYYPRGSKNAQPGRASVAICQPTPRSTRYSGLVKVHMAGDQDTDPSLNELLGEDSYSLEYSEAGQISCSVVGSQAARDAEKIAVILEITDVTTLLDTCQ